MSVFLIVTGVLAAWTVFVYFSPMGSCHRCKGHGRKATSKRKGRIRLCTRCKGTGRRPRIASRLVHSTALRLKKARKREMI